MTIAQLLLDRRGDDHPGIVFEESVVPWDAVVRASLSRAGLAVALLYPGQPPHIGVLLENVPEYLYWIGAAAFARATIVGINPTRRGDELAADIRHTDCQVIVTDAAGAALLAGLDTGAHRVVLVDDDAYPGVLGEPAEPPDTPDAADQLLLLFTSGSTGAPKAVRCTQGRMAGIAGRGTTIFGIGRESVCYVSMPLFHGNSLMACWAPALGAGATIALRRRFSASGFLPDVRRFGATYFSYVGRALAYVLATPEGPDDADNPLQLGFGTEAAGPDLERFSSRFGCRVFEGYGSSEGAVVISLTPDTPPGALGLPPPGAEVTILNQQTGDVCPRAQFDARGTLVNADEAIGEIVGMQAAASFEGYYRNPEAEAQRVRDGAFWSGDLGYRDEAGFFYFAGRGSDWLRVDSENFAAAPIERVLHRFPSVVVCAVYPVPDPRTGDQVMAAIELEPGAVFDAAAFEAFLARQPDLGTKWAPRFIRLVAAMPITPTNKVNKIGLRRERWDTDDRVWWRPEPSEPFLPMTAEARAKLESEFETHGRAHVLTTV